MYRTVIPFLLRFATILLRCSQRRAGRAAGGVFIRKGLYTSCLRCLWLKTKIGAICGCRWLLPIKHNFKPHHDFRHSKSGGTTGWDFVRMPRMQSNFCTAPHPCRSHRLHCLTMARPDLVFGQRLDVPKSVLGRWNGTRPKQRTRSLWPWK